jgi:hypothetical protein
MEANIMLTKAIFGLALVLAPASGALAYAKHAVAPDQNVHNPQGAYVGTDPDPRIRFELNRDWDHGRY